MIEVDKILKIFLLDHKFMFCVCSTGITSARFMETLWKGLGSVRGFLGLDFLKMYNSLLN